MTHKFKILIAVCIFTSVSFISAFLCFGGTITYTYDNLNRLTKVTYENGSTEEYAYDASGNRLRYTVNQNPSDTMPPALAITSHSNNQQVNTAIITLDGTATDGGQGDSGISQVTVNGARADNDTATGSGTANWSKVLTLNSGANIITAIAYDNSLNQNQSTQTITVYYNISDTTAPALTITSNTNGQVVNTANITLIGTASDSGLGDSGISQVTINGTRADNDTAIGSNTANWSKTVTLVSGTNSIIVVAYDNSANLNSVTQTINITYTPPCSTPGIPGSPSPADGSTGISTIPTLAWSGTANTDSYDVYFGTAVIPPLVTNSANTSYNPAVLNAGVTYYWKIVSKNACGHSTAGPVWTFTTQAEPVALSLKAGGWNLLSLPVEPTDLNPSSVFGPNLLAIYEWDAAGKLYAIPTTLTAKKGYWVAVGQDTDLEVVGVPPAGNSVYLLTGWNLVGPVETGVCPSGDPVLAVYGWGWPPNYQYVIPTQCEEGKGYWIAAGQEGDIW